MVHKVRSRMSKMLDKAGVDRDSTFAICLAVDEAVGEARRRSHRAGAGFVNAVLRKVARSPRPEEWPIGESDPLKRLAIATSHPDPLVERWMDRFGESATRALLEANNRAKPLQLLAFRDRGGPERLAAALAAEGVETRPAELSPLGLTVLAGDPLVGEAFRRGLRRVPKIHTPLAAVPKELTE